MIVHLRFTRKTTERQRQKGKEWIPAFAGMTTAEKGRTEAGMQHKGDCIQVFKERLLQKYGGEKLIA